MNVPKLRFPEFEGEWEESEFDELFQAIPTRNYQILASEILESGQYPVVDQGKEELAGYSNNAEKLLNDIPLILFGDHTTVLKYVDFPFVIGADGTKPLKVKEGDVAFQYFNLLLNNVEQEGYKRHFSILRQLLLSSPSLPEQKKIAAFLGVVDAKIAALRDRVAGLERYKRGLMQALFSQSLRFTKEDGTAFPDWKKRNLSFYLTEPKARNRDLAFSKEDVLSVSGYAGCVNQIEHMGRSYAGVSVRDYHIVITGDVVYTKSPLKLNPYGIIKANFGRDGIVSTLYAVYRPTENANALFIHYYFSLDDNLNRYLRPIVRKGAKNDMKVNNSDVLGDPVFFPSRDEQAKIAEALSAMDAKIAAVTGQLNHLQDFKKGLLQQMFV